MVTLRTKPFLHSAIAQWPFISKDYMLSSIFTELQDAHASTFPPVSLPVIWAWNWKSCSQSYFPEMKLTESACQSLGSLFITFGWKKNNWMGVKKGAGAKFGAWNLGNEGQATHRDLQSGQPKPHRGPIWITEPGIHLWPHFLHMHSTGVPFKQAVPRYQNNWYVQ